MVFFYPNGHIFFFPFQSDTIYISRFILCSFPSDCVILYNTYTVHVGLHVHVHIVRVKSLSVYSIVYLFPPSVKTFVTYLTERLQDHHSVQPRALHALRTLVRHHLMTTPFQIQKNGIEDDIYFLSQVSQTLEQRY